MPVKIGSISVFCGSRSGDNPIFASAAAQLGALLAHKKLSSSMGRVI